MFLTFGLFTAPNRYDLYCEPFADPLTLDRADRQASLTTWLQKYADRLADFTKRAPYNWFNLYEFWRAPTEPGSGDSRS